MQPSEIDGQIIEVLQSLSVNLSNTSNKVVADSLFQALYFAIADEGKYLPRLFPDADGFPSTLGETLEEENNFFRSKKESHSHAGRNCGRKFKKGEPIYRCVECEFDDTCVLCVHCFNRDDHVGHQISTSICYDGNQGICDCGDPEAWNVELNCKASQASPTPSSTNDQSFPAEYSHTLSQVYKTCLNFIIDVFANQNQSNKTIQEKFQRLVNERLDDELLDVLTQDIETTTELITSHTERSHSDSKYVLSFWNDEYHNFPEAQEAIIHAAAVTSEQAMSESNKIDREGRTVLKTANSIKELVPGLKNAFKDRFTASLTTERIFKTEELSKYIIDWIVDSINHPNHEFQILARRALCDAFCTDYETPAVPYWSNESKIFHGYTGLLKGTKLPGQASTPTRLQYLIFFDIRFWKVLRKKVHELVISVLVSDLEYKFIASNQITNIYDLLLRNLWKIDREPLLSVMDHIAVQFYTCPRNATDIVKTKLRIILPAILEFLNTCCHTVDGDSRLVLPKRFTDPSRARKMTMRRVMQDLAYFFDKAHTVAPLFSNLYVFGFFIDIIQKFDDIWNVVRKTGEHVENENNEYIEYYDVALHYFDILLIATKVESVKDLDRSCIEECAIELARCIFDSMAPNMSYKSYKDTRIMSFKVSSEESSFIFLSNNLLTRLFNLSIDSTASYQSLASKIEFLPIADRALRSVVLSKQIEANFWVRNGGAIFHQDSIYRDLKSFSSRMSRLDINLVQIAMLMLNPSDFLLDVLDRFELLDWFQNAVDLEHTVYEEKVFSVVQGLLSHLYVLLTERSNFTKYESEEKRAHHELKMSLIYTLYDGFKTFDAIEEALDSKLLQEKVFDEVLDEVATFNPPKGLQDDGSFQLKDEFYSKIDPLNFYANTKDLQDILPIIAKKLATDGKSPDDVIVEPRVLKLEHFKELGEFTRTFTFAKLIVKLLDYAVEKNNECFVPLVLHLLHAAIKDAELAYGRNFTVQSFFNVPLCEALFSISTTCDFAKSTVVKADHLLELLILKNPTEVMESLKFCFGDAAVDQFKEKKKTNGVDFDETEGERKRRLARERQKKILNKMKKSSKTFIDKFDLEHKDNPDDLEETFEGTPETIDGVKECILCRRPEDQMNMICVPVKISKSNVFRDLPHKNRDFVARAFNDWDEESLHAPSKEDYVGAPFPLSSSEYSDFFHSINFESGKVMSSCNHGIHYDCLKKHVIDNKLTSHSFPCPLCKTVHDEYVVSLLKKTDLTLENLSPKSLSIKMDYEGTGISSTDDGANTEVQVQDCGEMGGFLMFKSTKIFGFRGVKQMDALLHENFGHDYFDQVKFYKRVRLWTTIIGNTITQTEISTRINGNSSYFGFLNQIPGQTFKLFRNILPYYFLFQSEREVPEVMHKKDVNRLLIKGSFINAFSLIYFFNSDGLKITGESMVKSFVERYLRTFLKGSHELNEYHINPEDIIEHDNLSQYRSIMNSPNKNAPELPNEIVEKFQHDDKFANKIVTMIEKVLITNLRQLMIFVKILVQDFELKTTSAANVDEDLEERINPVTIIDSLLLSLGFSSYADILGSVKSVLYHHSTHDDIKSDSTIPYPGVIKLVDLPKNLNYFMTTMPESPSDGDGDLEVTARFPTSATSLQQSNIRNRVDFSICLICGHKVFKKTGQRELTQHIKEYSCSSENNGIFLVPSSNQIILISIIHGRAYIQRMNAPYLNTRGQSGPKAIRKGQIATLNSTRFKHLNELWLGNGVTSLLSRAIRRDRLAEGLLNIPNFNIPDAEDDDEDDDDDQAMNIGMMGGGDFPQGPGVAINNMQELELLQRIMNGLGGGGPAAGNDNGARILQLLEAAGLQVGGGGTGGGVPLGGARAHTPANEVADGFSDDGEFSDDYENEQDLDQAQERGELYGNGGESDQGDDHIDGNQMDFFRQLQDRLNGDDEDDEDYHDAEDMSAEEEGEEEGEEDEELYHDYEDDYDSENDQHPDDIPIHHINASDWDSFNESDEEDNSDNDNIIQEDGEGNEGEDQYYDHNPVGAADFREMLRRLGDGNGTPVLDHQFFGNNNNNHNHNHSNNEDYDDEESVWVDSDISID